MIGRLFRAAIPKVISPRTHGVIDYIHAASNFAAFAVFRNRNRAAANAALGLGAGVLLNALMTDYPYGVFRVYSFKTHAVVDYAIVAANETIPRLLGFTDLPEAKHFRVQAAAGALVTNISDYRDTSGSRHQLKRVVRDARRRRAA